MYKKTKNPQAWIVNPSDKGRKKIYLNNKVYLESNQEFAIELFNPLDVSVLSEIKINGKKASKNGLVLRPGERFYLDCFIDDKRKFIFKTYEVEDTEESNDAISNNGYVEVSFFKEKQHYQTYSSGTNIIKDGYNDIWFGTGVRYDTGTPIKLNGGIASGTSIGGDVKFSSSNTSTSTGGYTNMYFCNSTLDDVSLSCDSSYTINEGKRSKAKVKKSIDKIETGRVEKGSKSSQKFESVDMEFEYWTISQSIYQLLPEGRKPVETSELKMNFCSCCGSKLKTKYKFCPSCGEKL